MEYRLAPEAKCPDNIMDFYDALKVAVSTSPLITILCVLQYVSSNCEKWSLDPEQIIIRYSVLSLMWTLSSVILAPAAGRAGADTSPSGPWWCWRRGTRATW